MCNRIGKHSLLFWMLLLCGFISSYAQNAVKMIEPDNKETIFLLAHQPKVSLQGTVLSIETAEDKIECDASDSVRFLFHDTATSISDVETSAPVFKVSQTEIEGRNLTPGSQVAVYDLAGKKVCSSATDPEGNVSISLTNLSSGVYVFNSADKNFKFYKK